MGKLTAVRTYERFEMLREASQIADTSLTFILDTGLLYTHGLFFNSVIWGTDSSNTTTLNIAGVSKTLSLSGHNHSEYYNRNNDIDIGSNSIISGTDNSLLSYDSGLFIGNSSITSKVYGTLKVIKNLSEYNVLDTNNFLIRNQTISGNLSSNTVTFSYGGSNFLLDYVKRLNTISTLDSLATYTNMGTTNENSKTYGFITMYTDGLLSNTGYALLRIDIASNVLEFRTSSNTTWTGFLLGGSYKNLTVNGSTYAIASTNVTLPTLWAPTALGIGGQYLTTADDGLSLSWRTLTHPVNALDTAGIVAAPSSTDIGLVWKTDEYGNPAWRAEIAYTTDNNGLTVSSNQFRLSLLSTTKNTDEIGGKIYAVELDKNGKLAVAVPWTATTTLNSKTEDGYVLKGQGNPNKVWMTDEEGIPSWKTLDITNALSSATTEALGTIKVSSVAVTPISLYNGENAENRYYGVLIDSAGKAFVNIPWIAYSLANTATAGLVPGFTLTTKEESVSSNSYYFLGWLDNNFKWFTLPSNAFANTWKAANLSQEGYVPKSTASKILRSDANGALFWGDDTNTWNAMTGATSSADGTVGYVNATPPKDGYNTKFLRADGTWSIPAYPTKSSWNYNDMYVSSLTTNGNYLRWVKNGSNNDITIPYATNADTVDSEHASAFAHIGAHNNLTASGNEFTFASSAYSGAIWINYRTAGGTNGNITQYNFGNGKGGSLASISSGTFSGNCSGSAAYLVYSLMCAASKGDGYRKVASWSANSSSTHDTSILLLVTNHYSGHATGLFRVSYRKDANATSYSTSNTFARWESRANATLPTLVATVKCTATTSTLNIYLNSGAWQPFRFTKLDEGGWSTKTNSWTLYNGYDIDAIASIPSNETLLTTSDYSYAANAASASNAAKVGGYSVSSSATANTVALRQANGYLYATYYNASNSVENIASYTSYVMFKDSNGWLRCTTKAYFQSWLGLGSRAYDSTNYHPLNGKITVGGGSYSWYNVQQYNSSNANPSYYNATSAIININSYSGWQPWIRCVDSENGSWALGQYQNFVTLIRYVKSNTLNGQGTYNWTFNGDGSLTATKFVGDLQGTASSLVDGSSKMTSAYNKAGLNYADYTWLAGWNGYELRAVNKSQFAQASHTHAFSQITDGTSSSTASGWSHTLSNTYGGSQKSILYMCHGGGYGVHLRGYSTSASVYMLLIYNSSKEVLGVYGDGHATMAGPLTLNSAMIITASSSPSRLRMTTCNSASGSAVIDFTLDEAGSTQHFLILNTVNSNNLRFLNFWTKNGKGAISIVNNTNSVVGIGGGSSIATDANYKLHVFGTSLATAWNTSSDMRLKNVILNKEISLLQIAFSPLFTYTWKDMTHDHFIHVGSSALYWLPILPEVVLGDGTENNYLSLLYDVLGTVLGITVAREVFKLQQYIINLEQLISTLKERLQELERRLV